MALTEFTVGMRDPKAHEEGIISLTVDGIYFGQDKPDFEFAKILFDPDEGIVKLEPVATKEHLGVGYLKSMTRNGRTNYTLRSIRFAKSGVAPRGKYIKVAGEENTYRFYKPAARSADIRLGVKKAGYVRPRTRTIE